MAGPEKIVIHPQAIESLRRYREDLKAGHSGGAEFWRGAAAAYFTANPSLSIFQNPTIGPFFNKEDRSQLSEIMKSAWGRAKGITGKGISKIGGLFGDITTATGSDPTKDHEFRYKVIDLPDLITSHTTTLEPNKKYDQSLQPRVREREASKNQVINIARNLKPDALLLDVGALDRGSIIVGQDNMTESGNGRGIALKLASERFPDKYEAYRKRLIDISSQYGLSPSAIKKLKHPVLVRERLDDTNRAEFAAEANQIAVLAMSPYEQALQDAKGIPDSLVTSIKIGESQSVDQALTSKANRPIIQAFASNLSPNERAAVSDQSGNLNQLGLQRLKAAMFAKTFPGEAGQRLTQSFFESLDPTVKMVENGVFGALPSLVKAEGLIASGARYSNLSVAQDLSKAVDILARLKAQGVKPSEYIQQQSLFDRELTGTQEQLLLYLDSIGRSSKKIRGFIEDYAKRIEDSPSPAQTGLFGTIRPVKEDFLAKTIAANDSGVSGKISERLMMQASNPILSVITENAIRGVGLGLGFSAVNYITGKKARNPLGESNVLIANSKSDVRKFKSLAKRLNGTYSKRVMPDGVIVHSITYDED